MLAEQTSVLLANEDKDELRELADLVRAGGYEVCDLAIAPGEVADAIVENKPDVALVLVHDDAEHAIDLILEIRGFTEIPISVLARNFNDDAIRYAADHAVDVLHLPGEPDTIAGLIERSIQRHEEHDRLLRQISEFDGVLERRTVIEQAKGILMERHGVGSREAFALIRDQSRKNRLKLADVAYSVIAARELLSDLGEANLSE